MVKSMLIDSQDDLKVENGSIKLGNTTMQNVYILFNMNQGELKEDPIVGLNLLKMIRGGENKEKIRKTIEVGLARIGINIDDVKNEIDLIVNQSII